MEFRIKHETNYQFEQPVFLEPHILRFRPRTDADQRVMDYSLSISPPPAGLSEGIDFEGNPFTLAWFDCKVSSLTITAESVVRTNRVDPFGYLVLAHGRAPLPWALEGAKERALRRQEHSAADPVAALARRLAADSPFVVDFLTALNLELHGRTTVCIRETGDPFHPEDTLTNGVGSCRDLSVLFIDACRAVGVPARFVSGYQEGDPEQSRRDLHAWAEVYIPGAGWRGYDPTLGLAVADRHVAVAGAAEPQDASPVNGTYRGSAVPLPPTFALSIETVA